MVEVVDAYSLFLEVQHPDHHKLFQRRLTTDPNAARAEAVVFSWLRSQRMKPEIAESPATGGVDYLCVPKLRPPFLIEVTVLNREAVERRSGWPDELSDRADAFSMITPNLWSKGRHKAPQLADKEVARVLAICLSHVGASALLGTKAAEWLMVSEPKIEWPIDFEGTSVPSRNVTDLRNAAFFRLEFNRIVPVRQSISAILLIAIWDDQLNAVGLLHPQPAVPFDYGVFHNLPFLRVDWPFVAPDIRGEWVVGHPKPSRHYHRRVKITDDELRCK